MQRYLNKISGPLLDRIDLHVEVTPVAFDELSGNNEVENSENIRQKVIAARCIQIQRCAMPNANLQSQELKKHATLGPQCQSILKTAMERLKLSARSYDRIIRVARTIADLDASPQIQSQHIAEAINYRSLDRENWSG